MAQIVADQSQIHLLIRHMGARAVPEPVSRRLFVPDETRLAAEIDRLKTAFPKTRELYREVCALLFHGRACIRRWSGRLGSRLNGPVGLRGQFDVIAAVAEEVAIVTATNVSTGGSTLIKVAGTIARVLSDGFDVDVVGIRYRTKAELPSGTSIALGAALAAASGRDLASCAFYGHGADLSPRTT